MKRKSKGLLVLSMLWLICVVVFPLQARGTNFGSVQDSLSHRKRWAFKVAPMASFVGNFPIFVEKQVSRHLSLELAPGLTSKDLFFEIGRSAREGSNINETQADLRYSLYAGMRYYFSDWKSSLSGGYFSPNLEYRQYSALVNPCNPFNQPAGAQALFLPETRRQFYFRVSFGYQIISRRGFVFDMYSGIGVRGINSAIVTCETIQGSGMRPIIENRQNAAPTFQLGFRVGFSR